MKMAGSGNCRLGVILTISKRLNKEDKERDKFKNNLNHANLYNQEIDADLI